MWLDAFLSVAMVVVCFFAAPIVAVLGVPHAVLFSVGMISAGCAVLLAAFGAVTAVLLMLRMHDGDFLLPRRMKLPLPSGMNPPLD